MRHGPGMALPRKRRRRAPRDWSQGLDLHDYADVLSPYRRSAQPADDGPINVTDDLPRPLPVTDAELRIIEAHLRKELDELFGPLP